MGATSARSKSSEKEDRKSKKFEKKVKFYSDVRDHVSSLGAKKAITKNRKVRNRRRKLKAYDLSALSEFLPNLNDAPSQPNAPELKLNVKSRQKLVVYEGKQMKTVLNHPAFQMDPMASILQHLQSTQPAIPETPRIKHANKKKKGKKRNSSSGPKSMDI